MTTQFRQAPTYTTQMAAGINNNSAWYRYFQQAEVGTPPSAELPQIAVASPQSFTATAKGFFIVSGGAVTSIMFSRTAGVFYDTGQTSGVFPVAQNDVIKITFSAKPSVTFVPT